MNVSGFCEEEVIVDTCTLSSLEGFNLLVRIVDYTHARHVWSGKPWRRSTTTGQNVDEKPVLVEFTKNKSLTTRWVRFATVPEADSFVRMLAAFQPLSFSLAVALFKMERES